MNTLVEGDLQLQLPRGASGRRFDDGAAHGLTHCMKAVDFIIELSDRTLFVELKDPENPAAPPERRAEFVRRFVAGEIDRDFTLKYRDSFLYEWAAERINKPIHYLVLVALQNLDEALLLSRTDGLRRALPVDGPSNAAWTRKIVENCLVFNIVTWNRNLSQYPVSRISHTP